MPQFSLERLHGGGRQIHIQGYFLDPYWNVFLFSGLSNLKISVIRGEARGGRNHKWKARYELDFAGCSLDPETVDYQALSQQERQNFAPPHLTGFRLGRSADQFLEVALEGPDQLGFLGRVLGKISLFALFPRELDVDTVDDQIRDRIVLNGIGGRPPNPGQADVLEQVLRGWVVAS